MTQYRPLPEAVKYDRTERRKMGRRVYAETVGLSENRVHSLEHGRRPKAGEIAVLVQFIGDLLDPEYVAASVDPTATPPDTPAPAETVDESRVNAERAELGVAYMSVMNELQGRIPPVEWPSQFRLETVPPLEFPRIRKYLNDVLVWMEQQDGVQRGRVGEPELRPPLGGPAANPDLPPLPPTPPPVPEAPPETETPAAVTYSDDVDEEWERYADPSPVPTPTPPSNPVPSPVEIPSNGQQEQTLETPGGLDPNIWYVTNGELRTWSECQRRWYFSTYLQLGNPERRLVGPGAVGTRYHAPLAVWYQPVPGDPWGKFNEDVQNDRDYLEDTGAPPERAKQFETEVDLVRAMLEGYFEWVAETSADAGLTVVAPEAVVEANPQFPEAPHVRLLAKIDARMIDERDGSRVFIDHKSVGSFLDALKTLHLDEQMLHYHLVEYLKLVEEGLNLELRAAGALFNMARKVKRTERAEPPFYMREPVPHNRMQLQSYWQRVRGKVEAITRARQELDAGRSHLEVVPPHPTKDCSWKCEFYTVCPMMDDSTSRAEDFLAEQFVKIHPLARYEPEAVGETV
jgi:PD-(D/E)XK nuclease superfamily